MASGFGLSPHSTLEELYLATQLTRGLGSDNVDYRLRHAEFASAEGIRWLGTSIASLSELQRVLVVGSNLRKDHPLFAQRIRQAARKGCAVSAIHSVAQLTNPDAWAMPIKYAIAVDSTRWAQTLADVATAMAIEKGVVSPVAGIATAEASAIAVSLLSGERKAILLGNAAAHHPQASSLLAVVNWIGAQCGATVGYLTEAANTVGAQLAATPLSQSGLNAGQMLSNTLKAVMLLNVEPHADTALGSVGLQQAQMVVTLSPFKTNLAISDVLLPISPFTETSGTFVNAEGRAQGFHAVVKPLGNTRPAWKVLRVLANLLNLPDFDFESSQDVLAKLNLVTQDGVLQVPAAKLSNVTTAPMTATLSSLAPCTAGIYQLDGLVRRSPSLQLTADARQCVAKGVTA
jgi:NADH-quinone oxidoreductase subunit G